MSRRRQERRAMLSSSSEEDDSDDETAALIGGARFEDSFGWAADSCFAPLLRLDLALARSLHAAKKASLPLGVLSELFSLSGDEAIWFGVGGVGSVLFLLRLLGVVMSKMSCTEELCFELFGGAAVCCLVEQLFKFIFQRARPPWSLKQKQWLVPAELSLKILYHLMVGNRSLLPAAGLDPIRYSHFHIIDTDIPLILANILAFQRVLLVWATLVGLSRVLKGRHYPLDIIFGAVIGAALGIHLESHSASHDPNEPLAWYEDNYAESQWVKAVSGIILAVEWGFYYAIPLVSRKLAPWFLVVLEVMDESWAASHHREARGVAWWAVTMAFFGFYGKAFAVLVWSPSSNDNPFTPGLHKGALLRQSDAD